MQHKVGGIISKAEVGDVGILTHDLQDSGIHTFDRQHVRDERRIQLDGKPGRQIDSEMLVGNEHNTALGQDLDQRFPHQFRIGICQGLIRNLPYLSVGTAESIADRIELCAPTRDHRGRRSLRAGGARPGRVGARRRAVRRRPESR